MREDEGTDGDLLRTYCLDDHLERIGFHASTFSLDSVAIGADSIVALDPMSKADKVEEFLERLRTPTYRYEIMPQRTDASSQDLVITPVSAHSMRPEALRSFCPSRKSSSKLPGSARSVTQSTHSCTSKTEELMAS
jgi:hypothetical protein